MTWKLQWPIARVQEIIPAPEPTPVEVHNAAVLDLFDAVYDVNEAWLHARNMGIKASLWMDWDKRSIDIYRTERGNRIIQRDPNELLRDE